MRPIKMFGLAAAAAVAAMAFIGATSASALNTQLCNAHTALTCGSGAITISMNNAHDGVGTLLNSLANILCLTVSGEGTPLALANPQSVHVTALAFEECGTNSAHTNCEITVTELPLANLNKTGLDAGTLTGVNGKVFVFCEMSPFADIECEYTLLGVQVSIGAQHLTAFNTPISEIGSDFHCPPNPTLDGLLHTTANRYILA